LLCGQQEHGFAVLGAGKMGNGFVHGDQDHTALHSETKKIGIGDLLGAIEPSEKWAAMSAGAKLGQSAPRERGALAA
jgi:hypothetical protein